MVETFYELAGHLLVPDIARKTAFLFYGPKDTGKTTLINLLQALVGSANYSNLSLQDLADRFRPAGLVGKLANFFDDLPNTPIRNTGPFKALTGRGTLTVERKYGTPYSVLPFARLVFTTNELPRSLDTSEAYFDRWLIFPCVNVRPKDKQRSNLDDLLTTPDELSGFLNLALEGLERLIVRGHFEETESVIQPRHEYQLASDPIAEWIADVTVVPRALLMLSGGQPRLPAGGCADRR
jgi:putative DNA primase/helicase